MTLDEIQFNIDYATSIYGIAVRMREAAYLAEDRWEWSKWQVKVNHIAFRLSHLHRMWLTEARG